MTREERDVRDEAQRIVDDHLRRIGELDAIDQRDYEDMVRDEEVIVFERWERYGWPGE